MINHPNYKYKLLRVKYQLESSNMKVEESNNLKFYLSHHNIFKIIHKITKS